MAATAGARRQGGRAGRSGAARRGPKGEDGKALIIVDWRLDRAAYEATPVMSDGTQGAVLQLRELFEQFLGETR
jgi:hypothetical protein